MRLLPVGSKKDIVGWWSSHHYHRSTNLFLVLDQPFSSASSRRAKPTRFPASVVPLPEPQDMKFRLPVDSHGHRTPPVLFVPAAA